MSQVVLLGPQRFEPCVTQVVRGFGIEGAVATITAGWEDREPDDGELDSRLDGRSHNLHLYARWLDVLARDPDYREAERRRSEELDALQAVYLLRLHHAVVALHELQLREQGEAVLTAAIDDAVGALRALDAWHLAERDRIHAAFDTAVVPGDRPVIAAHRAELASLLADAGAIAIAGGHVGVLLGVLKLFDLRAPIGARPVVAWSAGAMAVATTVVLFHDHAVHDRRHAEVHDRGLGLVADVVALPHAHHRLATDDRARMSQLARRFAPARCLVLDDGAQVPVLDGALPAGCPVFGDDGQVRPHER